MSIFDKWFVSKEKYDALKQRVTNLEQNGSEALIKKTIEDAILYLFAYSGNGSSYHIARNDIRQLRGRLRKLIRAEVSLYDNTVTEKISEKAGEEKFIDSLVEKINKKQIK